MDEPKQTVTVTVTVQAGDTLEEIIYDLKETYGVKFALRLKGIMLLAAIFCRVNILFLIWRLRENET
jgi:nucleoid-associated protein YgaU